MKKSEREYKIAILFYALHVRIIPALCCIFVAANLLIVRAIINRFMYENMINVIINIIIVAISSFFGLNALIILCEGIE